MRILVLAAAASAAFSSVAMAQAPTRDLHPAPWWMREPVISSVGHVQLETEANRAAFQVGFQAVARTAAEANAEAAERARAFTDALRGLTPERVRLATQLSTQPLYQQYRDRDGQVQENERADQIERYATEASVAVEVRDVSIVQNVYNAALAARPTTTSQVEFALEPDNETKTRLYAAAVRDAARRAQLAAEAAGAKLGPARVIDPSARACQSDVLGGTTGGYPSTPRPTSVVQTSDGVIEEVVATSRRRPPPPPPAPAPGAGAAAQTPAVLALNPTRETIAATACVIYALAG